MTITPLDARRSLAEQDDRLLGGPLSILVRQKRDHQKLDRLLGRLSRTTGVRPRGRPVRSTGRRRRPARPTGPLATPHAASTAMRALATLPLPSSHGLVGLFAAYRATPGHFSDSHVAQLEAVAATVGILADARFDKTELAYRAQPPTLPIAVGIVSAHLGVDAEDALALLRAKAFALSATASALARDLTNGNVKVDDVMDPSDGV